MHKIQEITPLGSNSPHSDYFKGLNILEVANRSLVVLSARRERETELVDLIKEHLGLNLPDVAKSSCIGDLVARWIRPNTWMVEAPYIGQEILETELKKHVGNVGSVVDQTDVWCLFDINGPHCLNVLERLCNVDTSVMVAGAISSTQLEHLSCFIICKAEQRDFRIMGPRSAAASLRHAIISASVSVT
mgnify:CR=1 FL=1